MPRIANLIGPGFRRGDGGCGYGKDFFAEERKPHESAPQLVAPGAQHPILIFPKSHALARDVKSEIANAEIIFLMRETISLFGNCSTAAISLRVDTMSDKELVDELTAHARQLEDTNGGVNPFLIHEHELLMQAAQRLVQLSSGGAPPA